MTMSSSRPYLVRALYDWILENDCTPYILVNAEMAGVDVPLEHVKDGQIILNISPSAVQNLLIGIETLEFNGRFAGVAKSVFVPIDALLGIYAKENGQGMIFEPEPDGPNPPSGAGSNDKAEATNSNSDGAGKTKGKPSLRVVK